MYLLYIYLGIVFLFVQSSLWQKETSIITKIIIMLLNCYFAPHMLQSYKLLPSSGYLFCCIFVLLLTSIHTFQTILIRCFFFYLLPLFFCADIRLQLNEHLRCLDSRVEAQVSLVSELQDYFRRRAEVEMDYSKSLDKLAKSLQLRHKEQKQK